MAVRAVVGGVGRRGVAVLLAWSAAAGAQQPPTEFPSEASALPAGTPAPPSPASPSATPSASTTAVVAPPVPAVANVPPLPQSAVVSPAAPPPAPKSQPNWGIGAGVFGGGDSMLSNFAFSTLANPTFAGALEHRVGPNTWLALNATGSYDSRDVPLSSSFGSPDPAKVAVRTLGGALLLGLRHEIAHGPVDVAIFGGGFIAAQRVRHDTFEVSENFGGFQYNPSNTRSFGLVGGLTLERQLISGLAVRLSLELAKLSFSRTQTETLDSLGVGTPVDLSSRSFNVGLKPGLLLYFRF